MRQNKSNKGFTLIELLIVIAIIGILAAVLIPNLLNARSRAFDSASQTCLRELSTQLEIIASNSPFEYSLTGPPAIALVDAGGATVGGVDVAACDNVRTKGEVTDNHYVLAALHTNGTTAYTIRNGRGVITLAEDTAPTGAPATPGAFAAL